MTMLIYQNVPYPSVIHIRVFDSIKCYLSTVYVLRQTSDKSASLADTPPHEYSSIISLKASTTTFSFSLSTP